uniref:MI domain-containing protein n=1 Tax=Romanomermis culicivorax TaxID=13658 RepID=A0A915J211_ROMCU
MGRSKRSRSRSKSRSLSDGDSRRRRNNKADKQKSSRRGEREVESRKRREKRSSPHRLTDDVNRERSESPRLKNESVTKKVEADLTLTRAGGAYIPPAKLKMLQEQIADKSSEEYQRLAWEHLKKRIHGTVNKVNTKNLVKVVRDLLKENIIRGKGLFARSVIQAQAASPSFSNIFAALVAIINSKFPHIGELVIRRLTIQFKRAIVHRNKPVAISATKFIAHLTNQQVVHELLSLEILALLLENATDDSVEVAVSFIKECGAKLTELAPRAIDGIFASFRYILNENVSDRIQYMLEVLFQIRKEKFAAHPGIIPDLDLVEADDQITHTIALDDLIDPENKLKILGEDDDDDDDEEGSDEDEDENGEGGATEEGEKKTVIIDNTEANLVALRRTVYLTIQSSLSYEEAAHKLMKMKIAPEMEPEICNMLLDCCAQNRTFEKFFGLLAGQFCRIKKDYQQFFEQLFKDSYDTIHRFDIGKIRNISKFFAHLLFSDSISWMVLGHIHLNERDTTSAGRVFIKILLQELTEIFGLEKLYGRIRDATMQEAFDGLFPRDDPHDTRFAINFFTSIGLGGLT